MECLSDKVSIWLTSVIRELSSATSSSDGQSLCNDVSILVMIRQTLVASEPPYVAFEPLNELAVSSAVWKVNLGVGAFFVD